MNDNNRVDLKIHGQGSSSGGKFKTVSIMGEGRIDGDVDCKNIKVYGEGKIYGSVKATNTVSIKGQTLIKGDLEAGKIKIQGEIDVDGEIFADEAIITGNINIEGNCNAEILTLEGGFKVGGLLNADILKINLHWHCKVNEIGGSEITVKKDGRLSFLGLKNMFSPGGHNELVADLIEGDDIYLENTHAKVVRGNNITLGPGCEIGIVEYKNNFKQDKEAEVGTSNNI
jgi:cytoskeletal protein CcmA (bactofilin family)